MTTNECICGGEPDAMCNVHGVRLAESPAIVACYDCGLAYGSEGWIECVVPNDVWAQISPTGNEGGILCITCITRRCARRGLADVSVMLCGTEVIKVAGQAEAFDRGWKCAEKRILELEASIAGSQL